MSMEEKGNHQNLGTPTFCRNGCGFYAAQAFDGMCSKCYKDVKQQIHEPVVDGHAASSAVDDVDAVAVALSRTSLSEMNVNASSSNNPVSPNSSSENLVPTPKLGTSAVNLSGDGVASQLETASPTVPSVKGATAAATVADDATNASTSTVTAEADLPSVALPEGEAEDDKGKKPKKNRCMECRKKVGLTGFQCHCGKLFCSLHRYSDTHECTFDFREKGQEEIRKNNPVIKGEKVKKI